MSTVENTEALIAAEAKQKQADDIEQVTSFYLDKGLKCWHVYCLGHGAIIGVEVLLEDRPVALHVDGATPIPVDNQLLSFRTRTDNSMGYSCVCGANTILLPEEREFERTDITLPHIQEQIKDAIAQRPSNYVADELFKRVEVSNG